MFEIDRPVTIRKYDAIGEGGRGGKGWKRLTAERSGCGINAHIPQIINIIRNAHINGERDVFDDILVIIR